MKKIHRKNAAALLEYVMLLIMIIAGLLMSQKFIVRGFAGRWKEVADTFGYGRQYDPAVTVECLWSEEFETWYDAQCFEEEGDVCNCRSQKCCDRDSNGNCLSGSCP